MAYYPNPFDEDEEERRRRLGLAADTETEESTEPKPMSEMSTREAVAAAYDKQHPYGGTATMTGPLGNISYYDEELNKPRNNSHILNTKNFDDDIISNNNSTFSNISNWVDEKNRISALPISDENKHQYMSCLAGKGGTLMNLAGLTLGIGKEALDITTKLSNPNLKQQYGGTFGVLGDSLKDMRNNFRGLQHAYDGCSDCQALLYHKKP